MLFSYLPRGKKQHELIGNNNGFKVKYSYDIWTDRDFRKIGFEYIKSALCEFMVVGNRGRTTRHDH